MINIAIDGPSGAGKSTVAKALAKKLGYIYVDTGALYRAIGLYVRRAGVLPENSAGVIALLPEIDVRLAYENGEQKVLLAGEDVGSLIRTNEISAYASKVSAIPEVRTFLLELQRDMARKNNVIMDGRDIGTVILPDADVKIFMTASPEARIRRRYEELLASGQSVTLEEVAAAVHERDKNDSTRKVAPAIPAADAVFVDNSGTFENTLSNVISIIEEKIKCAFSIALPLFLHRYITGFFTA